MTFAVFKLLFSNVYSMGDFWAGFKKGPKGIIKNLLIILLAIYCFAVFTALFSMTFLSVYANLESIGKTHLMPGYGLVLGLMITLFFGFLSVATNYYTGTGEEQLMCMPLKEKEIFGGKFAVSVISDSLFGALVVVICSVIYGLKQGSFTNPLFYIGMIASILTICIVSVFFLYLVFIVILTLIPAMRKKNILHGIATVIIIAFSACCGMLGSMGGNMMAGNPSYQNIDTATPIVNSWIGRVSELKAVSLFANCLIGDWLSILIMIAVGALIAFVFVPLISPLYIRSLNGFSDVKTKKMNTEQVNKVLHDSVKGKSVFSAMYWRDVKTVLREPAFFANGPLMVFLMPLFFIVPTLFAMFKIDGVALDELTYTFYEFYTIGAEEAVAKANYIVMLVFAAVTIFTGTSSGIGGTAFSREGKGLGNLKAMPVLSETILQAKFAHAFTYCVISNLLFLIYVTGVMAVLKLGFLIGFLLKPLLLAILLSLVVSILLVFLEMFIDTVNPKLNWENPMAAFKQNVNSVICIFGTMAFAALFVGLGFLLPKNMIGFAILLVVFTGLAAPTGYFYFKYAKKRFINM